MQRLDVSCAVRRIYIYVVWRQTVNSLPSKHAKSNIWHPKALVSTFFGDSMKSLRQITNNYQVMEMNARWKWFKPASADDYKE